MRLPETFTCAVRGLSFQPGYPGNVMALHDAATLARLRALPEPRVDFALKREPDNAHDSNAVLVVESATGEVFGHLAASAARLIARDLDNGVEWQCTLHAIRVRPEGDDNPGMDVLLRRKRNR